MLTETGNKSCLDLKRTEDSCWAFRRSRGIRRHPRKRLRSELSEQVRPPRALGLFRRGHDAAAGRASSAVSRIDDSLSRRAMLYRLCYQTTYLRSGCDHINRSVSFFLLRSVVILVASFTLVAWHNSDRRTLERSTARREPALRVPNVDPALGKSRESPVEGFASFTADLHLRFVQVNAQQPPNPPRRQDDGDDEVD